jgi:hypothetical protein
MRHLTDGELQAWLDAELAGTEAAAAADHLAGCGTCRDRMAELRAAAERFREAVALLDAEALASRTRRRQRRGWRITTGIVGRAAALILVAAGVALAVVPGSPLRSLWNARGPSPALVEPTPVPVAGPGPAPVAASDVAVTLAPGLRSLLVSVRDFPAGSEIRVRTVDGVEARARVGRGGADTRFAVASGTIEIRGPGSSASPVPVVIELPRGLREATVEVDGEIAVRARAGRLKPERPALDSLREDVTFRVGG